MKGIDCTAKITPAIAKSLKSSGYKFVCRYLVPDSPILRWKRLVSDEVKALTDEGMFVVSVFETTANRPKEGFVAGTIDGKKAAFEAALINQPRGSTIYFAVDYDASASDYHLIESYLQAAKVELPDYKIGVYGGYRVIEEMAKRKACDCFWQTYAWSSGLLSKHANIYQNKNGVYVAGIQCDLNDSYGNEGWWNYMQDKKDWKEIIKEVADSPEKWEKAIQAASKAAASTGDLGDLEILKYLPELIEKVYKCK